ncbi:MAG: SLC13 family permease [Candidatus Korarchaeum sp.]
MEVSILPVISQSAIPGLLILAAALLISSLQPRRKALVFIVALALLANLYRVNLEEFFIKRVEIMKVIISIFGLEVLSALLSKGSFFEISSQSILRKVKSPVSIFIVLNLLNALLSALLSNILVLSYMMLVAVRLTACIPEFDPTDLMISLVVSSNLGSMATFIGDISNIIVGVNAGIGFLDFLMVAAPISIISTLISLSVLLIRVLRRKRLKCVSEARFWDVVQDYDRSYLIFGSFSMILMLSLLLLSRSLRIDESVAIGVIAIFLLFLGGERISKVFMEVEWVSIAYVGSLLLTTELINFIGGFDVLAELISGVHTRLNVYLMSIGLSMFVDDAEAVAILSPVLRKLSVSGETWWALIVGTSIGSALTPWGSMANLIALRTVREMYREINPLRFLYVSALAVLPVIPVGYALICILGGG